MELSSQKIINGVRMISATRFDAGLMSSIERQEKGVYTFEYDFTAYDFLFNFNFYPDGFCVLKLTEKDIYLTVSLYLPEGEENKYSVGDCINFNVLLSGDEKVALLSKLLL